MATSDRQSATAARPPAVFASVDTPADEARQWLTEHFDQQAAQGEPDALTPEQRLELAQLLSSAWWRAVFEDERSDEDLGGSGPAVVPTGMPPELDELRRAYRLGTDLGFQASDEGISP